MYKIKIILLVVVLFTIVSCTGTDNGPSSSNPNITFPAQNTNIKLEQINLCILNTSMTKEDYEKNQLDMRDINSSWNDFLREKYKLEIISVDINSKLIHPISELDDSILEVISKTKYSEGLYVISYFDFCKLAATPLLDKYFIPIETLYDENAELAQLPKQYTDVTLDFNGTTWGVAFDYNHENMPGRYYKKESLIECGMDAPKTIDEFYEVCLSLKKHYPDKTVISFPTAIHSPFYQISDVLGAYGINNLNTIGYIKTIQYNHKTDSIEDLMLGDEFKSALQFIRLLNSSGILNTELTSEILPGFNEGRILTHYSTTRQPEWSFDELEFVPYLVKDGIEPLYKYNTYKRVVLISRNAVNSAKTMELYCSLIYGSESYLDLRYGESYDISKYDDYLVVTYEPETMPYPPAVGKIESSGLIQYPENTGFPKNEYVFWHQYVNEFINSKEYQQVYKPFNLYDYLILEAGSETLVGLEQTLSAFDRVIGKNLLNDQVSLDELYTEYFNEIKRINGDEYMRRINEKAGKVWKNHYD